VEANDRAVAEEWLDKLWIAALPGSAFGAAGAGHLRLSLACSDDDLNAALDKLKKHYGIQRKARAG
jgi:aspartate/methionine/tyrosine aminotransferase